MFREQTLSEIQARNTFIEILGARITKRQKKYLYYSKSLTVREGEQGHLVYRARCRDGKTNDDERAVRVIIVIMQMHYHYANAPVHLKLRTRFVVVVLAAVVRDSLNVGRRWAPHPL